MENPIAPTPLKLLVGSNLPAAIALGFGLWKNKLLSGQIELESTKASKKEGG